jgi:predicted nucleic acid-binding protein
MSETIKRVYVDTTVIYGAPDKKYSQGSRRFWEAVRNGRIIILASDVLGDELKRAPQHIQNSFDRLPKSFIERVSSTPESNALAALYITENVVGKTNLNDCKHIAMATLTRADAIVAWNFQHIVDRGDGYNNVNEKLGYPRIEIQTPEQFMEAHYGKR